MNNDEKEFLQKLKQWQVDVPPANLADKIVHHATMQAQYQPFAIKVAQAFEVAFTQWNYGLSYKLAGLAICAVVGFSSSNIITNVEPDDIFLQATSMAFGYEEWSWL